MFFKNSFCLNIYGHLDVVYTQFCLIFKQCQLLLPKILQVFVFQRECNLEFKNSIQIFTNDFFDDAFPRNTLKNTNLWKKRAPFCQILQEQCPTLIFLDYSLSKACSYLMCESRIVCTLSYLVHPGNLVPFLWEINHSYNQLYN